MSCPTRPSRAQAFFAPQADDAAALALKDAIREKYGIEALRNIQVLGQLPIEDEDYSVQPSMPRDQMPSSVRILYTSSDERMGLERVKQLAVNVEIVRIPGRHVEALQRVAKGEEAREMAARFNEFLG